jgi:hypothetical protein
MEEMRNSYKILFRKAERKRPLWINRHRWKDNIIVYVKEIGCEVVDYIDMGHHRIQSY